MRRRILPYLFFLPTLIGPAACGGAGDGPTPVDPGVGAPASVSRVAGDAQQTTVASALPVQPTVVVRDADGRPVPNLNVSFSVVSGGGWVTAHTATTDAAGTASTTWYTGPRAGEPNRLVAGAAGSLTVDFTATATPLVAGTTYVGAHGYVELVAGELPIIVSAPHGGTLQPASIPDRTGNVTTVRDSNTDLLAEDIITAFRTKTGAAPSVIILRLHRIKMDANRDSAEATLGHPLAWRAWREFQGYIEAARAALVAAQRQGFYIDLHGHGHEIQRLELGYMLTSTDLAQPDAVLNSAPLVQISAMRAFVQSSGLPHTEVIRGASSLGTLFELHGYPSVPSQAQPHPAGAPFFSGGYNTGRHASADGSLISGVQIEANMTGVRDNAQNRHRFADALVDVLGAWQPALLAPQQPAAQSLVGMARPDSLVSAGGR